MFNLMKKDFLLQKRLLIVYVILLIFYLRADFNIVFSVVMISSLFVMNSHYYDEKDKANMLLNSLPYTKKEIVSSKYIEALLSAVIVILLFVIGQYVVDSSLVNFSFIQIISCFLGTMIFTAFYLPFFYKFTQQYILIGFSAVIVLVVISARPITEFVVSNFPETIQTLQEMATFQIYSMVTILVLIIYGFSWILSIKIYSNKAF